MTTYAIDYWYRLMRDTDPTAKLMFQALATEMPDCVTWTATRWCNLDCAHCVYQQEHKTPDATQRENQAVVNLASQLPPHGRVLHDGRVLLPQHLPTLKAIRAIRPDVKIGLIDNGIAPATLRSSGVKLDWYDLSVDGPENIHDHQRRKTGAFRKTIEAAAQREFMLRDSGTLSALMCITSINYREIEATAKLAFAHGFDKLFLSFFSPVAHQVDLSLTSEQFAVAWRQIENVFAQRDRVHLPLYKIEDLKQLELLLGKQRLTEAFTNAKVRPQDGSVVMQLGAVTIEFSPLSMWKETAALVDADNALRVAMSAQFSLHELQTGVSRAGQDTSAYTILPQIAADADLTELYQRRVCHWAKTLGAHALKREQAFFRSLT